MAAIVVLVVLVAACSRGGGEEDPQPPAAEDRIISNVWRTADDTVLEVGWFATTCEKFDSIDVTERPDRIDLLLQAFVDSDNCAEPGTVIIEVELDAPVGDRLVYDINPFIQNTVLVEDPR